MPKDMKNRNITIYICLYKFQSAFNVNVIVLIGIILKVVVVQVGKYLNFHMKLHQPPLKTYNTLENVGYKIFLSAMHNAILGFTEIVKTLV